MVRRLVVAMTTGLILGIALIGGAQGQSADDPAALNAKAITLYKAGKYAEATEIFERLFTTYQKAMGNDDPNVGALLNNLAELYRVQGRYAEAERYYKRSQTALLKAFGREHPNYAQVLNGLATVYLFQGRYEEAEQLYSRSLLIREKALGSEHPDVGQSLTNLATLNLYRGRYPEAERLYKRSIPILEKSLGPNHPEVGTSLNNVGLLHDNQGRYAEAEKLYRRSLAIREKVLGPEHSDVAVSLSNLAMLHYKQGRYAEVEPLYRRSLAINERVLGPDHPMVGTALSNLAALYEKQDRYDEAELLYKRSLTIREKALGQQHSDVALTLNNLAHIYHSVGRHAEAEPLYRRAIAVSEKALGFEHPQVALTLNNLARLYEDQDRFGEAEPIYQRSLAVREKTLGREHDHVAQSLHNLSSLYSKQARYPEAERLLKRSLAIYEKALGPENADVGNSLSNLAALYLNQGRFAEAEPLFKRSLAIGEKILGRQHSTVALSLNNLALLYQMQSRFTEVEPLYRRSLTINEKAFGPEHPIVATSLSNLAVLYESQDRVADAEPLYRRSLAIREKAFGPEHLSVSYSLNNLGVAFAMQGRQFDAEPLLKRSLAIREKALGPDHPLVASTLSNMAVLALEQNDLETAALFWRRSTGIFQRRTERGLERERDELWTAQKSSSDFWALVKATYRLPVPANISVKARAEEMFVTAQWAQQSEVAASLAQMAARSAKGTPQLASLVRERQDLLLEWQSKDKKLIATKSEAHTKRKLDVERMLSDRVAAIDIRLSEIDRRLARDFPTYAALATPAPMSVEQVQAQLNADEALVLFLATPKLKEAAQETFIWVVTKSAMRWVRSDLGAAALTSEVMALRCGLDAAAWHSQRGEKCTAALAGDNNGPASGQPLTFDHGRAHALYAALFGEVQDLVHGKHLIVVPSGPLTQLPLQVLVAKRPTSSNHREAAWLAREHAITVLPAVASLRALRQVGRPSTASKPMIGFGNPLLNGPDVRYVGAAKLAQGKQRCSETAREHPARVADLPRIANGVETRGGLANVSLIKMQAPLPETADELCAVAAHVNAGASSIHLGAQATERNVKRLSANGELAKHRLLHFATHGVLAGQLDGTREPGLILTPPDEASEEDDGYLSAAEIASLKLDADWVVLSACNTAAGGAEAPEALSGLAKAFVYAGARSLLVSHWAVDSEATVKLITGAVKAMTGDGNIGRAEALRRSMLSMIDGDKSRDSHPSSWAAFVVVGEGARN